MNIHIFGASSISGLEFRKLIQLSGYNFKIFSYSSKDKNYNFLDLRNFKSENFQNKDETSIVVSFAPIWDFSIFLETVSKNKYDILSNVKGYIICSSSSSSTKRFAANLYDKNLSMKIKNSEKKIISLSTTLKKKCVIIQPTLIYGSHSIFKDKNISKIVQLIRISPFVLVPNKSGFRQPIHIRQLAKVFIHFVKEITFEKTTFKKYNLKKILVGGDEEISYENMIKKIIGFLNKNNKFVFCKVITLPNRFFLFLFSPLILFSPKLFDSIQRLNSNLSGFTKAHQITKDEIETFPIEPF